MEPGQCLLLHRALYVLKQASKAWNGLFDDTIRKLGLAGTVKDPCVYVDKKNLRYLTVYVDDGLVIISRERSCLEVIEQLNRTFKTNRITGDVFLGMQITNVDRGIFINQSRYVEDVL